MSHPPAPFAEVRQEGWGGGLRFHPALGCHQAQYALACLGLALCSKVIGIPGVSHRPLCAFKRDSMASRCKRRDVHLCTAAVFLLPCALLHAE